MSAAQTICRREGPPENGLTSVELLWIENREERWLRFGQIAREQVLDRRRRLLFLRPGSCFAFVRWKANAFGTVQSRLDVLRAPKSEESYQTVPHVMPGAVILLRVNSWPRVQQVLDLIDRIEALDIAPEDVPSSYWRHVHNRLAVGQQPRFYSLTQHAAVLQRRKLLS